MEEKLNNLIRRVITELIVSSDINISRLRHEVNHIFNTLEWLYKFVDMPSSNMMLACALHDCERFFEVRCVNKESYEDYNEYKKIHSKNSAIIGEEILRSIGCKKEEVLTVSKIIELHEFGGTSESNLLKDCDSMAFFDENFFDYLKKNGRAKTKQKVIFTYHRLSEEGKKRFVEEDFICKNLPFFDRLCAELVKSSGIKK